MALNSLVDSRDVRFVVFEALETDKLSRYDRFASFDKDSYEAILELAEQLAIEHIYPANEQADKIGVQYDPRTKTVTVPEAFKSAIKLYIESGFSSMGNKPEWGGMGMPEVIYREVMEYFNAASVAFCSYSTLKIGASKLIENFGSESLKKIYLEKMVSGQWGGTMCLTEPCAGTDVGALKSKAIRQKDGTYLICGQKIFISAGDNDIYENIIHPVLARIEGDPAGSPGVSIFIVPKYQVNPDGTLGKLNDVTTTGIEHKMGIKGLSTCSLSFGENEQCIGYLLGAERQGLKIMFQMMNEARLDVAMQGLGAASSAYMHAVTYAKNRIQGTDQAKKGDFTSVPIVKHPDVRRMLLWMKAHVEAMRMLTMLAAYSEDISHVEKDDKAKEARALLDFLIPLCKAGNSDLAWLITSEAMQVYGGYGYCTEYRVEQLARDCKILSLYEGTNGIQSIDLTTRKLLMNPEMYNYQIFKKRISETIDKSQGIVEEKYISVIKTAVDRMDQTIKKLTVCKEQHNMMEIYAVATPLQQSFRMLAHAWMHLWALSIAVPKLQAITGEINVDKLNSIIKDNSEAAYYYGKILSARFFLGSEFQHYFGFLNYILAGEQAVVESSESIFTGALAQ